MLPKLTTNGKLLKVFSEDEENMVIFIPKEERSTAYWFWNGFDLKKSKSQNPTTADLSKLRRRQTLFSVFKKVLNTLSAHIVNFKWSLGWCTNYLGQSLSLVNNENFFFLNILIEIAGHGVKTRFKKWLSFHFQTKIGSINQFILHWVGVFVLSSQQRLTSTHPDNIQVCHFVGLGGSSLLRLIWVWLRIKQTVDVNSLI